MTATSMMPFAPPATTGHLVRLTRLDRHADGRLLIVPLDHNVTTGPVADPAALNTIVRGVAENGGDAVVLHKGRVRFIDPDCFRDVGLIVHLSASTSFAVDADAKTIVAQVEDAIACGADAVSVHVNVGAETEAAQLADLGAVAEACRRWNMPLLAMMYPRGPRITAPNQPDLVAHVAAVGAELGADIVKVPWAGDAESMADVVRSCPVPVVVAGGTPPATVEGMRTHIRGVMSSGAQGLAMGRGVFAADDPADMVREIADIVHGRCFSGAPAPAVDRAMVLQPS